MSQDDKKIPFYDPTKAESVTETGKELLKAWLIRDVLIKAGRLHVVEQDDGVEIGKVEVINGEHLQADQSPIDFYTLPPDADRTFNLEVGVWSRIKEAAKESTWIPEQYWMNDWVSDVVRFLKGADEDDFELEADAFEQWALGEGYDVTRASDGSFVDDDTDNAFSGWMASKGDAAMYPDLDRVKMRRVAREVANAINKWNAPYYQMNDIELDAIINKVMEEFK